MNTIKHFIFTFFIIILPAISFCGCVILLALNGFNALLIFGATVSAAISGCGICLDN